MKRALIVFVAVVGCDRAPSPSTHDRPSLFELAGEPTAQLAVVAPTSSPPLAVVDPCGAPSSFASGARELASEDGVSRTVLIDAPALDPAQPNAAHPLLLAYHGWGGDPDQLERTTGLVAAALARGYVVARPLGIGKSFNAGTCCGDASEQKVDDVRFARTLVATLEQQVCIDRRRVYAAGFSNGGFLSHRLGCESADLFAAIASVSGTFGVDSCSPSRPVSVLHIHGKADGIVKFGGDPTRGWSSVATVIDAWVRADRCALDDAREVYARGAARCVRSGACEGGVEVTLCRDDRAGHTWPGGPRSTGYGGTRDLDATTSILEFFARHQAP